jgi:hypothetical protein
MEKLNQEEYANRFQSAQEKSRRFGFFSLTAQDHKDMGSTPSDELLRNQGKAQYEVMTDEEIAAYLDYAVECLTDPVFEKNGVANIQKDFLRTSIPFLKSVNRLPSKFEGYDLECLVG